MSRPRLLVVAAVLLVGGWLLWSIAGRLYVAPRAERLTRRADLQRRVAGYEEALGRADEVRRDLRAFVDRTLGPDRDAVDHRLRKSLNRIAEEVALGRATVGTGAATRRPSPGRREFKGAEARALRDELDFVELEGWVSGEGTLPQTIELVDRIDAEPWIKRLDVVRIDPRGEGDRFAVTVRLTTLFLPGREPTPASSTVTATTYDPARRAAFAALVEKNPFRVPPPPPPPAPAPVAVAPPAPPAPPPPPAPFPWREWRVSGVATGTGGPEVWLRHAGGEARRLGVGEAIDAAVFVGATADWAEFRLGDGRFRVRVGEPLDHRSPVNE